MTHHHYNDPNKDEYVEQHDNEDWTEKSSPESSDMGQKTTIALQKVNLNAFSLNETYNDMSSELLALFTMISLSMS